MNKLILSLVGVASLAALPVLTLGADGPAPKDAGLMKVPANAATFMCRAAGAGEKATGTIGTQSVVCKSNQAMMTGSGMMKVPNTTGLDGAATDKAWRDWLTSILSMQPRAGDG